MLDRMNYQQILQIHDYAKYLFRENNRIVAMLVDGDLTGRSDEYMAQWLYALQNARDARTMAYNSILNCKDHLEYRRRLVGN